MVHLTVDELGVFSKQTPFPSSAGIKQLHLAVGQSIRTADFGVDWISSIAKSPASSRGSNRGAFGPG